MDSNDSNSQELEFQIQLLSDMSIDVEDIESLKISLCDELEEVSGVMDVRPVPSKDIATQGAKVAGEVVTLGALLLAILPDTIPVLINFLKEWTKRPGNPLTKISIKNGDQNIDLEYDPQNTSITEIVELINALKPKN